MLVGRIQRIPSIIFTSELPQFDINRKLDGTFKQINEKDRHNLSATDSVKYNKEFQAYCTEIAEKKRLENSMDKFEKENNNPESEVEYRVINN